MSTVSSVERFGCTRVLNIDIHVFLISLLCSVCCVMCKVCPSDSVVVFQIFSNSSCLYIVLCNVMPNYIVQAFVPLSACVHVLVYV